MGNVWCTDAQETDFAVAIFHGEIRFLMQVGARLSPFR